MVGSRHPTQRELREASIHRIRLDVVLNESAGAVLGTPRTDWVNTLQVWFDAAGTDARVRVVPAAAVAGAVRRAAAARDVDAVVIGGGDGTVATAASLLLSSGKALGLLPLGTMNLLARDLGMPADLRAAVAVLAAGHVRHIDVAEVNGRIFLNNAVLGLYPALARARERQRGLGGVQMGIAMAEAAYKSLRYYNLLELDVDLGQGPRRVQTPALAVVNNLYGNGEKSFLDRPVLDGGQLGLYLTKHRTRWGLIRFMVHLIQGGWQSDAGLECFTRTELTVTSRKRHRLRVTLDGEQFRLPQPLIFRIRPRALPVLVPEGGSFPP